MKLVARRAQMKTDRVCYFCGLPGTITKEHVWPQWQHDDAEVVPKRTLRTVGFRRTADGGLNWTKRALRPLPNNNDRVNIDNNISPHFNNTLFQITNELHCP